jgi:hypothetical protein
MLTQKETPYGDFVHEYLVLQLKYFTTMDKFYLLTRQVQVIQEQFFHWTQNLKPIQTSFPFN